MFKNTIDLLVFLASGASAAFGNMLLKAGMNKIGTLNLTFDNLIPTLFRMFSRWEIILGFVFYFGSSILYLKVLTSGEVTKIYPAIVSYMFILLLLLGTIFLRESLTFTKVLGILIIISGIIVATK